MGPVGPIGPRGEKGETGEQGLQGIQGPKGNTGDTGPMGPVGPQGERGEKGDKGDIGPTGPANTLSIGAVTKGDDASATITGTAPNQTLNLVLPKGDKGDKGDTGNTGATGATGPANTLSIGVVQSGATADATITGTSPNQTLNLVLPKGDKGDTGATGPQGEQGIQGLQGPAGRDGAIQYTAGDGIDITNNIISVINGVKTITQDVYIKDLDPGVYICNRTYSLYTYTNQSYYIQADGILEVSPDSNNSQHKNYSIITKNYYSYRAGSYESGSDCKIFIGSTSSYLYQYNSLLENILYTNKEQSISALKTFSVLPKSSVTPTSSNHLTRKGYVDTQVATKQDILVSGTNIKTINNENILGSGNISISGGTPTDVQINGTSIVSNNTANLLTNSAYSSTNKIATMSDINAAIGAALNSSY